ncbi:MAG: hypothetical protein FWH12_02460 [Treponema sp.]|nr:hypothetical protein [Treponema sp.]
MRLSRFPLWIRVESGIIVDTHHSTVAQPGMIETPWNSEANVGVPVAWYDDNWKRIPDDRLVEMGIRTDNRGRYWSKENYTVDITIRDYDLPIPDGFTDIPPLGKPSIWEDDHWIVDEVEYANQRAILNLDDVILFVSGLHEGLRRGQEVTEA